MSAGDVKLETVRTLLHNNAVFWAAFSGDGKRLATASLDNTVKLWDTADGAHVGTLIGHGDGVAFVEYLKDGRIVTASLDKTLKVWANDGMLQKTLSGHQEYLACAAVQRGGTLLASGGFDKTVRLWNADAPAELAVLTGHEAPVHAVALSPDGSLLASGGGDNAIRLWDVETKRYQKSLVGHSATVDAIVFAPKEKLLASAGGDGSIRLWSYGGEPIAEIQTRSPRVKALAFSPDGLWLASGCSDGAVRLWNVADRREVAAAIEHKNTVYGVAFHPQGKQLASAGFDRTIRLWNIAESRSAVMSVNEIYRAATDRRNAIKNLRIAYEVTPRPLATLPSMENGKYFISDVPYRVRFAFEGERRIYQCVYPADGEARAGNDRSRHRRPVVAVFDGVQSISERDAGPLRLNHSKVKDCDAHERYCEDVLGIPLSDHARATYDNSWLFPHCLRPMIGAQATYRVLRELEEVDGHWCHVVVADGYDRLYVDPSIGCAFRKRERFCGPHTNVLFQTQMLSDFVEVDSEIWVPQRVESTVFAGPNEPKEYWNTPFAEAKLQVTEIAVNCVTDSDFKPNIRPGRYVVDTSNGEVHQIPEATIIDPEKSRDAGSPG